MSKKIYIFDTTLRDGEQSPGISLNIKEKLQIAFQLAKLNVDAIEAGFPTASIGDFEAVKAIAQQVEGPIITGLARADKKDIDRAWEALKYSKKPRIHTFIATSDIHLKHKLKMSKDEVLKRSIEMVKYAKSLGAEVQFSAEDASRTDKKFLYAIYEAVIDAGATIINVPDTVGYSMPGEFGELIKNIKENVKNIDKAIISVHCHNDLGMAVANTLSAMENGACQLECTINGLGERAGNAALEEIIMAINTRGDSYKGYTDVTTQQIYHTSNLVSKLTGFSVQPNKAIVGKNAFAHESGIHQHGVLNERTTYEIMTPESVGLSQTQMVLGKHSGRHAFEDRLNELGYSLSKEEVTEAFKKFKELTDKKKDISDKDIEAIICEKIIEIPEVYKMEYFHISSGNRTISTSTVKLNKSDVIIEEASTGHGPVDATFKSIEKAVGIDITLADYFIKAVTSGEDALGEVTVKILNKNNERQYLGRGISTDIIEASAKAYLNAINNMIYTEKQ